MPAPVEVLNDVNGELVNLYRVVQHHLEEFVRQFKWAISSRQVFKWHQQSAPETLTDIQRAARFYYLQQHAFDGFPMLGQSIKYSVNNTTAGGPSTSRELVITNWEPGTQTNGLF